MAEAAYYNVHGQPLSLSAKDAVLAREPNAYARNRKVERVVPGKKPRPEVLWEVFRPRADGKHRASDRLIGDGATEESAWRNTLSRMRIADNEEAERG